MKKSKAKVRPQVKRRRRVTRRLTVAERTLETSLRGVSALAKALAKDFGTLTRFVDTVERRVQKVEAVCTPELRVQVAEARREMERGLESIEFHRTHHTGRPFTNDEVQMLDRTHARSAEILATVNELVRRIERLEHGNRAVGSTPQLQ